MLDLVIAQWQELAAEHRASGRYASELTFERIAPYRGDDYMVAVQNVAPYAQVLEDGHAGFHLPSVIDWGAAEARGTAKRTAKGTRYLTIAFRHYTPGSESGGISSARARAMMPRQVYNDARIAADAARSADERRAAAARITAAGTQLSRPYDVLDRMFPGAGGGKAPRYYDLARAGEARDGQPGYTWRSRTYEGLRRTEQVNPETGAKSSTFSTLRTLTEDSLGWFVPPMPGFGFAARTVQAVAPMARDLLEEAARADVVELVRSVMSGEAA